MPCITVMGAILNITPQYRLRLLDGRYVWMSWHNMCGPMVFYDKNESREILEWWNDPMILRAVEWFQKRGCKA